MADARTHPEGAAPLVVVAGPTGSGKSELSLRLAERFPAEVVNCDSLQIYRHFHIGTAKLPPEERRGVPHHLMDIAEPDENFTAGDYARLGRPLLVEIAGRGRVPIVVGGTGFYLRALLDGLFQGPTRNENLRARLADRERRRPGSLHRLLTRFDPASAKRIHANDTNKLVRALEVCLLARRPMTDLLHQGRQPLRGFCPLKIGLDPPRAELYQRLDARCRSMFEEGLVDEVRRILSMGFAQRCKPFEALGYREALLVLNEDFSLESAIEETQRATRRYAKRQWTWFRREADMEWFAGFGDENKIQRRVVERVCAYLKNFPAFQ